MHVFRWDLDRTYLETEIRSVRGLVRAALEVAAEKRTVPGAAALLRALVAHDPAARVAILSGSPLQMRDVLEEKLRLDGVRFDVLTLKDNLGNLRRGRLKALRGQVGYKLPHLLVDRATLPVAARETLFGDDSETDGLIYAAYAEAVAGRLPEDELVALLQAGDAYSDGIEVARAALARIPRAEAVEDVFIRIDRGVPLASFRSLGPRVIPVFSWFQAALVLFARGRVGSAAVSEVAAASAADPVNAAALAQDAVRRGLVARDTLESALAASAIAPHVRLALDRLGLWTPAPPPPARPDLMAFLRVVRSR